MIAEKYADIIKNALEQNPRHLGISQACVELIEGRINGDIVTFLPLGDPNNNAILGVLFNDATLLALAFSGEAASVFATNAPIQFYDWILEKVDELSVPVGDGALEQLTAAHRAVEAMSTEYESHTDRPNQTLH